VKGYVYVGVSVAIVVIGIFAIDHFASFQSSNVVTPQVPHGTQDCVGHIAKARELAETWIGQANMSSDNFHFDSIQCIFGNGVNDTNELKTVIVEYTSTCGRAIIFTEDLLLSKVISSSVWQPCPIGGYPIGGQVLNDSTR
jgi:predicted membrane protein